MQFSPVKITADALITRSDGTKEYISAIDLFEKVNIEENDSTTDHPSEK